MENGWKRINDKNERPASHEMVVECEGALSCPTLGNHLQATPGLPWVRGRRGLPVLGIVPGSNGRWQSLERD